jgi:asparagine synthase (glutamine-hydrolysing)
MYLLAQRVHASGYKVVLTGEGAEEFLAGYDIFKEAKIRRFWARQPESRWRPALFRRLYSDISALSSTRGTFLQAFFKEGFTDTEARGYSHVIRWRNTRRSRRFFSREFLASLDGRSALDAIGYPDRFETWGPLERSQYLETTIFLSQYLLSSQGDRMAMAHSVEGRFPFLDYRVVEFCNGLPSRFKLRGLTEKYLLRKLATPWLPQEIWQRTKRPYRAPIHKSFFTAPLPYIEHLLSADVTKDASVFDAAAVGHLRDKIRRGDPIAETEDMALAGIVSTHVLYEKFVADFSTASPLGASDDVKVCVGALV